MKRIFYFIPLIILFVACSTVKLGYNNADWILPWLVDDYFDLDADQESFVEDRISYHLKWHRDTELPRYSSFIEEATIKLEDGVSSDEYDWIAEELRQSYANLIEQILPDAAEMLLSLKPQQIAFIENKMLEKNKERSERPERSEEEQILNKEQKIIDRVEDWVGVLNEEQVMQIRELSHGLPDNTDIFRKDRVRRQQVFLELLRSKPPKEEFIKDFHIYMTDYNNGRPQELVEKSKLYWEASKQLTLAIVKILSSDQKRKAIERIREYQVDFIELASNE